MKHTAFLQWNIILERHYLSNPDEVGTVQFWESEIYQLIAQNPFPKFWGGLKIEIRHMNDPELKKIENQPNVLDRDLNQAGCQNSQELCFMNGARRIQIAVYPERWTAEQSGPNTITDYQLFISKCSLSHGVGHLQADLIGLFGSRDRISAELTSRFRKMRPGHAQSEVEDAAEIYRAVMGSDTVRGTYSDNVKSTDISNELKLLMKSAFWLSDNLKNQNVSELAFGNGFASWAISGWFTKTLYRLNVSTFQHERWTGSAWVKN